MDLGKLFNQLYGIPNKGHPQVLVKNDEHPCPQGRRKIPFFSTSHFSRSFCEVCKNRNGPRSELKSPGFYPNGMAGTRSHLPILNAALFNQPFPVRMFFLSVVFFFVFPGGSGVFWLVVRFLEFMDFRRGAER